MRQFLDKAIPLAGSAILHAVVIGLLFVNFDWGGDPEPPVQTTIKARIVADESGSRRPQPEPVPAEPSRAEIAERQRREAERVARERREAEAQAAREREAQAARERAENERREREAAEAQAREQAEREAAEQRAREEAERKAREEAERKAREEAERQAREEAERKAREAAERKAREEAERKAREEAARREREAAERRAAAARQAEFEQQLQDALDAEEERQGAIDRGLQARYIELIRQAVRRNWRVPPGVGEGIVCTVRVRQLRSGDVVSVVISDCPGGEALSRSLETAVRRASPLPPPDNPSLFEANLTLKFNTSELD